MDAAGHPFLLVIQQRNPYHPSHWLGTGGLVSGRREKCAVNVTKCGVIVGVFCLERTVANRMRRGCLIAGFLVWIALGLPFSSEGQYTANFQTNVISGVTSNWPGNYYLGDTFSVNVLLVQSNGVLTDAVGYLGYSSTSSNNSALVTDSGSIWSNGFLFVGFNGFGNSLVVSNGAQVLVSEFAQVGDGSPRISSNSISVTGNRSVWSNGQDLAVGYPGACNRVVVNNGGLLIDNRGYLGSYASGSSNNSVLVSDTGSVWTNASDVRIGDSGGANSLTISNGGNVFGAYGYVGYGGGTNSVLVSGAGSIWTNALDLYIGYSGAGNSLAILGGAAVCSTVGHIGYNSTAANNSVTIGGTGSVWNANSDMYVGENGSNNNLSVSDGGQLIPGADGTLYVGGDVNNSTTASRNHVVVSGGVIRNANSFFSPAAYIGYSGSGNSLVISNGGQLISGYGYVGERSSSSNNIALVTGVGSVWSNRSDLYVGDYGSSNTLVISGGGLVNDSGSYVGYSSSSNNTVLVTGTGSVWSNGGGLYFDFSRNNSLAISNGGQLINLGSAYFLRDNIVVTGTGSVWNSGNSTFGGGGGLVITNGGNVVDGVAYAGSGFDNSNFTVRVADGAVWQNDALYVGSQGPGNSVTVAGGTVLATNLVIGIDTATCDNWVQLDSGNVFVTNATGDAVLEARYGTLILNGGTLQVDTLVMTNTCGLFVWNGGGTVIVNNLMLDPNLSAVGDGIPNGWKQQYGLNPLDSTLAGKDLDGSGVTVLQDYLVGVDPTNPAAAFRITSVVPTGNNLFVTWIMGSGRTNALQATAGDASGGYNTNNFSDIFTVTNTVGTTTNYLDTGAATNVPARYYRVRLVP